ncbi:MAG: serine/threonine protein kinase [Deltaproteobacteria bacterium]|nr:serine/threonine protein kinase [Deltaproteobacteria bacterium]
MRKLGSDGVTESFAGILDEPAGKQVVVRKIMPYLLMDPAMRAATEARVQDLKAIRHPTLVPIVDLVADGDDRYIIEDWVDAVDLRAILVHCLANHQEIPPNVYLNLATQVCNGLEALHGRPGSASGAEHVLHMALKPEAIYLTASGKLLVGHYGLTATPTTLPKAGVSGGTPAATEYLSPEQTQPDQALSPASDIFSLGSILYEILTLEPLFRAESNLQTIHRVRRAEVTAQLLKVKEMMSGLDKVLYRALSLNPRHRYQRAFVLREDLRGLMAGYSFANITDDTSRFLTPLFDAQGSRGRAAAAAQQESSLDDTASILRHSLSQSGKDPRSLGQAPEDSGPVPSSAPPPDSTEAFLAQARGDSHLATPTLEPSDAEAMDEDTVTHPSPIDAPPHEESTSWEQGGASGAPSPSEPVKDDKHTTWFPAGGSVEEPSDFEDERPTDVRPEPTPPPPARRDALAAAAPPPPVSVEEPPEEPSYEYDDDDLYPERGSNTGILVGVGAAVAAVIALLVCGGIVGGGGLLYTRGTPEPITPVVSVPEPAVADVDPTTTTTEPDPTTTTEPETPSTTPEVPTTTPTTTTRPTTTTTTRPTTTTTTRPTTTTTTRPTTTTTTRPTTTTTRPTTTTTPTTTTDPVVSLPGDEPFDPGDLSQYSDRAYRGDLSDTERRGLELVDRSDPDWTRAQVLLYQDAKGRDDLTGRERHIEGIMSSPENQYNPQYLTEQAEIAMRRDDFATALERANLAERHWARLPSELIFSRKAMIYDIQASAHQGKFYESGGEDLESLYQAIRSWEKYQRHVQTKSRDDLTVRAEEQLAKLYDMKRRMEQP